MTRKFSQARHDRLIRSVYGDHAPGSRKRWEENRLMAQDQQRRQAREREARELYARHEAIIAECRAAYAAALVSVGAA
jgi:hypothetical protein